MMCSFLASRGERASRRQVTSSQGAYPGNEIQGLETCRAPRAPNLLWLLGGVARGRGGLPRICVDPPGTSSRRQQVTSSRQEVTSPRRARNLSPTMHRQAPLKGFVTCCLPRASPSPLFVWGVIGVWVREREGGGSREAREERDRERERREEGMSGGEDTVVRGDERLAFGSPY